MNIFLSPHTDPALNLATESYLRAESAEDWLMVYINDPCVVIGRNQCAEAEADIAYCRANGIKVIRRISGGGAVYHDRGNVNWSFIRCGDSVLASGKDDLFLIIRILQDMGLKVTAGERSELLAGDRKISGTASYSRAGRYIFHGTLLFDTDLAVLQNALRGDKSLRGKKIASVPSPVINIVQLIPQFHTSKEFAAGFVSEALTITGGTATNADISTATIEDYYPRIIL